MLRSCATWLLLGGCALVLFVSGSYTVLHDTGREFAGNVTYVELEGCWYSRTGCTTVGLVGRPPLQLVGSAGVAGAKVGDHVSKHAGDLAYYRNGREYPWFGSGIIFPLVAGSGVFLIMALVRVASVVCAYRRARPGPMPRAQIV